MRPADRAQAAAAGLRAVHQGEPRLQPARRTRRDQRHRAAELHPARPRPRQGMLRGVAGDASREACPERSRRGGVMAELLLELLSEEIPARMQTRAADDLRRLVCDELKAAGLAFSDARAFATPRRLTLVVDGLPAARPDVSEERRGPRVGAPEPAIQGFLKAAGLASLDQAEKRDTGKGEFWFAVIKKQGGPTGEVLPGIIDTVMKTLPWPKSMKWSNGTRLWVRPLQSVIALFDGQ